MNVNMSHLHLMLNHFPVIGTMVALALFLISFVGKNGDLRRASFIIFAAIALLAIPTFLSGYGAQDVIGKMPGVSHALIQRHLGAALLSFWFIEITGSLALVGLWQWHQRSRPARWNVIAIFIFSLLTMALMVRTGNTGGDIRHPEIWATAQAPVAEGTMGSILHVFEPKPAKFAQLMVVSKWWWAFMMDLHFVGLALLIGTVGLLDARIMGFLKQLPIAPVHKFIPWAMAGLAVNVVTGMLAFIGESENYVNNVAFWIKMLALMLLGVNVAAFYLTGIFDKVEPLGAGEDAPMSAKLIAISSLVLWIAVITFGRYIQGVDSISF